MSYYSFGRKRYKQDKTLTITNIAATNSLIQLKLVLAIF